MERRGVRCSERLDPQSGMDVEALAALLERGARPALIYALSDGHNPLNVSMNLATRQRLVLGFLEAGYLEGHLHRLLGEYRTRRDVLLESLEAPFPSEARWTRPTSGIFVWVELPSGLDTLALLRRAVEEEQVAFLPGAAFAVEGGARPPTACGSTSPTPAPRNYGRPWLGWAACCGGCNPRWAFAPGRALCPGSGRTSTPP